MSFAPMPAAHRPARRGAAMFGEIARGALGQQWDHKSGIHRFEGTRSREEIEAEIAAIAGDDAGGAATDLNDIRVQA